MSKHEKTLARLKKKPPPSDIRWDDLVTLLKSLGYELLKNSGSRRKFYNKGTQALIICHEPHPQPHVDKGAVADLARHLEDRGF